MSSVPQSIARDQRSVGREGIVSDSLISGLIFALGMTVAQRLLGVVRGVLFCRLMTDQELGQWSMVYGFLMMLAPLAVLGLPGSFGKFVEQYIRTRQLQAFLRQIARICLITTSLLAIAIVLAPDWFSYQILGEPGHHTMMYGMSATLVLVTFLNYLTSLVEAMRQIRLATIMRFVSGVSFAVAGIAVLMTPVDGALSVLGAFALSSALGALPAIWYLRKRRRFIAGLSEPVQARELWLELAPFAAWWWMSNLLHNAFELVDRYMLVHFSTTEPGLVQASLGQYHSSRVIPLLMVGIAAMLSGLLLPYVSASVAEGNSTRARQQLNLTIKFCSLGMMLVNLALLLTSPFLFDYVLQGRYNEGLLILPLTMVYCAWFSIQTISQDYLWVSNRGKYAVACMGLGLAGNIGLNAILIPQYGLWGAVIATSAGNLLSVFAIYVANMRFGCPPDSGCWTGLLFPLTLLCPPVVGILLVLMTLGLVLTSNWYFSSGEKEEIRDLLLKKLNRLMP